MGWGRTGPARGAGVPLVLLVAVVLFVVGAALAQLCLFHYAVAGGRWRTARATLLAQAAVAQFQETMRRASDAARGRGLDLESRRVDDPQLADLYRARDPLPDRPPAGLDGEVCITFDSSRPFFSVDNLSGEYPAAGWRDRGTAHRSVPPFTVDLVVTVRIDGEVHHFEAFVQRRWPYALLVNRGGIVMSGSVVDTGGRLRIEAPSRVKGPVASLEGDRAAGVTLHEMLRDVWPPPHDGGAAGNLFVPPDDPLYSGYNVVSSSLVALGPSVSLSGRAGPGVKGGAPVLPNPGNLLEGDVFVAAGHDPRRFPDAREAVWKGPENVFSGDVRYGAFASGLTADSNPLRHMKVPTLSDPTYNLVLLPGPGSALARRMLDAPLGYLGSDEARRPFFPLLRDLQIDPDAAVKGRVIRLFAGAEDGAEGPFRFAVLPQESDPIVVSGGQGHRYVIPGDVGNRFVRSVEDGQTVYRSATRNPRPRGTEAIETPCRMVLRNCTLLVDGNLDLFSSAGADRGRLGIEGTNATLIVNGDLILSGGRLESRDQGMVIWARRVLTRASGVYRGIVMSGGPMAILPPSDDASVTDFLQLHGALLAGGQYPAGLTLRSTRIEYDASYLKPLHGYGDPIVSAWREF